MYRKVARTCSDATLPSRSLPPYGRSTTSRCSVARSSWLWKNVACTCHGRGMSPTFFQSCPCFNSRLRSWGFRSLVYPPRLLYLECLGNRKKRCEILLRKPRYASTSNPTDFFSKTSLSALHPACCSSTRSTPLPQNEKVPKEKWKGESLRSF